MLRSEAEIRQALEKVEAHYTGEEDGEDPIEVIRETLLFVLGDRTLDAITDHLPLD